MSANLLTTQFETQLRATRQSRATGLPLPHDDNNMLDNILKFRADFVRKYPQHNTNGANLSKFATIKDASDFRDMLGRTRLAELESFIADFVYYCYAPIKLFIDSEDSSYSYDEVVNSPRYAGLPDLRRAMVARHKLLLELEKDPADTLIAINVGWIAFCSAIALAALSNSIDVLPKYDAAVSKNDLSEKNKAFGNLILDGLLIFAAISAALYNGSRWLSRASIRGPAGSNENFASWIQTSSAAVTQARPTLLP